MTTNPSPLQQIPEDLPLAPRDRIAAEAVATGLRDAKADNTRRAYASAWRRFDQWADGPSATKHVASGAPRR